MQVGACGAGWAVGSKPQRPFGGGSDLSSGATALSGVVEEGTETHLCYGPRCPLQRSGLHCPHSRFWLLLAHLGDPETDHGASFGGCLSYPLLFIMLEGSFEKKVLQLLRKE